MKKILFFIILTLTLVSSAYADSEINSIKNRTKAVEKNISVPIINYGITDSNIRNKMNAAKKYKIGIKIKKTYKSSAAEQINSIVESKKIKQLVSGYEHQLLTSHRYQYHKYVSKKLLNKVSKLQKELNNKHRLFLVISASVPISTLRNMVNQDEQTGGIITFVLRGTVGSATYMVPTARFIEKLINTKNNKFKNVPFVINPIITEQFNITNAPALVYVKNFDQNSYVKTANEKDYIVYGTAPLKFDLKKIYQYTKSRYIKKIMKML